MEYSTGELFFQAGPDGGRDLKDADPLIGRTLANIMGRQDAVQLPQLLEVAAANSPASRYLSTTRQLMDPRKGLLTKATNLTTGVALGARARHNENGRVTQILIARETIQLTGYSDIDFRGKVLRMTMEGPCALP